MEVIDQNRKYREARRKAREIRGFYIHLTVYCFVIPMLIGVNLLFVPKIIWFPFSMIGWGIGLLFHGLQVFGRVPFLGKDWEEKKINEFIKTDKTMETTNFQGAQASDFQQMQRYDYARKRAKAIAGFYKHLAAYLIVNFFLIATRFFQVDDSSDFLTFNTFSTAFFWGIGLALHAFNTFGVKLALGQDWEERKIREYMEKDKQKSSRWE